MCAARAVHCTWQQTDLIRASNIKKSADAVDASGKPIEIKTNNTPTKSAVDNALRRAAHGQSSDILLRLKSAMDSDVLKSAIYDRVQRTRNITSVTVIDTDDSVKTYARSEILSWKDKYYKGKK